MGWQLLQRALDHSTWITQPPLSKSKLEVQWTPSTILSSNEFMSTGHIFNFIKERLFKAQPRLTVWFTKLPDCVPSYRTVSRDCSCQQLPFTANGHFSIPQELYQAKQVWIQGAWGPGSPCGQILRPQLSF